MEKDCGGYPGRTIIGDKDIYKRIKACINSITMSTLEVWFRIIKYYRMKRKGNMLKMGGI